MSLDELIDIVEVARLSNRVVVVTVRQLLPNDILRFAQSEQLLHMRRWYNLVP